MAAEASKNIETLNVKTSDNTIPSGLRADIMRESMENKNLLSQKGSIYVGTGKSMSKECTVNGETQNASISKTDALTPGEDGQILTVDSSEEKGLKYGYISADNFGFDNVDLSEKSITLSGKQLKDNSVDNGKLVPGAYPNVHKIRHEISGLNVRSKASADINGASAADSSLSSSTLSVDASTSVDIPQGTLTLSEGTEGYLSMSFEKQEYYSSFSVSLSSGTASISAADKAKMLDHTYACFYVVINQAEDQSQFYSIGNVHFGSLVDNFAYLSGPGPITTDSVDNVEYYYHPFYNLKLSWGNSSDGKITIEGIKWIQTIRTFDYNNQISFEQTGLTGELLFIPIN